MDRREEICLKELKGVLAEFDSSEYSLNGEKDSAICMERSDTEWRVYECERAAKRELQIYSNIVEACLDVIKRLACADDLRRLTNEFLDAIMQIRIAS